MSTFSLLLYWKTICKQFTIELLGDWLPIVDRTSELDKLEIEGTSKKMWFVQVIQEKRKFLFLFKKLCTHEFFYTIFVHIIYDFQIIYVNIYIFVYN